MNKDIQQFFLIAGIIVIFIWYIYPYLTSTECFDTTNNKTVQNSNDINMPDIQIPLSNFDANTRSITAASEFVGMPEEILPAWGQNTIGGYGYDMALDDGNYGNSGVQYNLCSKSCCTPQYPPPFMLPVDALVSQSKDKFVTSSYTCNNSWQNSGCLCLREKQAEFLNGRGKNKY